MRISELSNNQVNLLGTNGWYLEYGEGNNDADWKVIHLNCIQETLRSLGCFYTNTHLKVVTAKLREEAELPLSLEVKMFDLFASNFPNRENPFRLEKVHPEPEIDLEPTFKRKDPAKIDLSSNVAPYVFRSNDCNIYFVGKSDVKHQADVVVQIFIAEDPDAPEVPPWFLVVPNRPGLPEGNSLRLNVVQKVYASPNYDEIVEEFGAVIHKILALISQWNQQAPEPLRSVTIPILSLIKINGYDEIFRRAFLEEALEVILTHVDLEQDLLEINLTFKDDTEEDALEFGKIIDYLNKRDPSEVKDEN